MRPDLAAKRLQEIQNKKQARKEFWQPTPGTRPNRIRLLPRWDLDFDLAFYRETMNHRNLGLERNKQAICLISEGGSKCPACELKNNLYATKDTGDAEYARSILARTKVYYNLMDLDDLDKGVQIWSSGIDVLEQLLAFVSNPMYGDIADPQTGRNISLYFTEATKSKSGFNSYRVQPDPERSPLSDPTWLEQMHDLDKMVKMLNYDELEALIYGREDVPTDQEPDAAPAPALTPARAPKIDKPCFEKARYSKKDAECLDCELADACAAKKEAASASVPEPKAIPAPSPTLPATPAAIPPATQTGPKTDASDIIGRLRAQRAAEKAAKK